LKKKIITFVLVILATTVITSLPLSGVSAANTSSQTSKASASSAASTVNTSSGDDVTLTPYLNSGNAVAIYNVDGKQVLYSNRGKEKISPTAATKLLTMMVVYDIFKENNLDLKTEITVESAALLNIGQQGDKSAPFLGLSSGETYKAEDLIGATLVANMNDACNIMAYYCATKLLNGNMDTFIARMNKKAEEIGAKDSTFKNAVGLVVDGMTTTPEDVARIAGAFYKYNDLLLLDNRAKMTFNNKSTIHTKNYLLSDFLITNYKNKNAIGLMAGQRSDTEGYCLITATEKDGLAYIIVVMEASGEIRGTDGSRSFGAGNAYDDVATLINWTRKSFAYQKLVNENELITELKVEMGKSYDYVAVVPEQKVELLVNKAVDLTKVEKQITLDPNLVYESGEESQINTVKAPIMKGQVVGTLTFTYNGTVIGSVNLITQNTVDESKLMSTASSIKDFLFGSTMKVILIVFALIIVAYTLFSLVASIVRGIKKIKKDNDE
jgi:D-alanyl-D-alanine carboxypeptidase (penicillin-binding protein 5/6)